ncbi:fimbrial protein [Enterobacteriaceae bacterium C23F]
MKALLLTVILFFVASLSAYGSCNTNQGGSYPQVMNITLPDIVVQRDKAVGEVIYTTSTPESNNVLYCNYGGYYSEMSMFNSNTNIAHVYQTNVPGVGVSVSTSSSYYENPAYYSSFTMSSRNVFFASRTINFIKTGPITSNTLSSGLLARNYGDGDKVTALSYNLVGSKVTQLACSISTPTLTFPIGDILASSFGTSVGSTPSGAQNTQNLGLNCDAGANINVSLQGTQNPDVSTTSVLALTGQGSADVASGVGVQLVYNGSPLVLNNRIVLKKSAGGQETFPITARYYQTKTAVTVGKANASATLDLTYQ